VDAFLVFVQAFNREKDGPAQRLAPPRGRADRAHRCCGSAATEQECQSNASNLLGDCVIKLELLDRWEDSVDAFLVFVQAFHLGHPYFSPSGHGTGEQVCLSQWHMQGYLDHKKQPPPPRTTIGP